MVSDGGKEEVLDGEKKEVFKEDGEKNKFDDFEVFVIVLREFLLMIDEEDFIESEKIE